MATGRILVDYPLSEVMKFLQGEYLFVCVNKQWQAEYLRQFKEEVTSVNALDTNGRRKWLARTPAAYMQLFAVSPMKAYQMFLLAKRHLSPPDLAHACCVYLQNFSDDKERRAFFSYELDQIQGQEVWKSRAYFLCLMRSVVNRNADSVMYFENHVESLSEDEQTLLFSQACFAQNSEIMLIVVDRLIPLKRAIEYARAFHEEELIEMLEILLYTDRFMKVWFIMIILLLLYAIL